MGTLADPILRLDNNGSGPALDLQVERGKAPMTVNSDAGTATNLSADMIDGQNSTAFLGATRRPPTQTSSAGSTPQASCMETARSTKVRPPWIRVPAFQMCSWIREILGSASNTFARTM